MTRASVPVPLWRRAIEQWPEAKREEWQERAGILEYCAGHPREEAERIAYEMVQARWLRRSEIKADFDGTCLCDRCKEK